MSAREALRNPRGASPLRSVIGRDDRIVIVINDVTRPTPSDRILPWILDELGHVPPEQFEIIIGNGSHRACTPGEVAALVGPRMHGGVRVVNHDAFDVNANAQIGTMEDGTRVLLNARYAESGKRIAIGFIEPHFFAGFSGGPKVVMPGIAGIETIMRFHSPGMIMHPLSTWGVLEGNPVQAMAARVAAMRRPDFTVNVSLDGNNRITGFFAGDMLAAHREGAEFVRSHSMRACARPYDIVVTTNSGHPLDRNLYQSVKGICAAAAIVKPGGAILCCAECADGLPEHGNFGAILAMRPDPESLIALLLDPGFSMTDGWQVLKLALVLRRAGVHLYSGLPDDAVRRAHLIPCADPGERLGELIARHGPSPRIAVLPRGPMVIPHLS